MILILSTQKEEGSVLRCLPPFGFFVLFCIQPAFAAADVGFEQHRKLYGVLHLFHQQVFDLLKLVQRRFDNQLVVYLQNQPGRKLLSLQPPVDLDHGNLDDVGSGALNRGVHSDPLAEVDDIFVGRVDFRQCAAATEHRFGAHR